MLSHPDCLVSRDNILGWRAQPEDYMLSFSPWFNVITHDNSKITTLGLGFNYGSSIRCLKD